MTNKKNMLSWVLKPSISIIAIIIIVLIGGGYLWFSSQREGDIVVVEGGEENGQEVENGDNTENLELNTDDWLTYRNEEYGFEVKYPGEWKIRTDKISDEKFGVLSLNPIDQIGFITLMVMSETNPDDSSLSLQKCKISIGDINGYTFCENVHFVNDSNYKSGVSIIFIKHGTVFSISWYDNEYVNESAYNDFKKIIQTIKFDE